MTSRRSPSPASPTSGSVVSFDGRLAIPICLPAGELSRLLGALAAALYAVSRDASAADGDAAALSHLLQRELR